MTATDRSEREDDVGDAGGGPPQVAGVAHEPPVRQTARRTTAILRVAVVAEVLLILIQAILAGQIVSANEIARAWHEANAYVILLVALLQLALTTIIWRRRGPAWLAGTALLLVVAVMLQMQFGYAHQLAFHLPLGVAIFGLAVTLLWRAPVAVSAG